VAPVTAHHWKNGLWQVSRWLSNDDTSDTATTNKPAPVPLTVNGKHAPVAGEIFTNPVMAHVLSDLGRDGAKASFYEGQSGKAIVEATQKHGGTLTLQDLRHHTSLVQEPICVRYRGIKLWQVPPIGQGVAGLIGLAGLQHLEEKQACPVISPETIGSADTHHIMMEMMRLGFADARAHVACPESMQVDNDWLVDPVRIGERAEKLFRNDHAGIHGMPDAGSRTVSFQVVDNEGNAISFVNSNYHGFGAG
jgi:gamma-glutamyltranspeptidase/glutathione hydrolase